MAALSKTTVGDAIKAALVSAGVLAFAAGLWPKRFQEGIGAVLPYLTQPRVAVMTPAAEDNDVIDVAIQIKDTQGTDADEITEIIAELYDANGDLANPAAFHLGESGAGAEITTTDKARLFLSTDANGAATLEVTDVGGASGATLQLVLRVLSSGNTLGAETRAAITFD